MTDKDITKIRIGGFDISIIGIKELEIKVLGMGCAQCHSLTQTVMELLTELNCPANLDHVTDIKEIARYGVMGTPALVINGKIVMVGRVPPRNQLKAWLIDANRSLARKV